MSPWPAPLVVFALALVLGVWCWALAWAVLAVGRITARGLRVRVLRRQLTLADVYPRGLYVDADRWDRHAVTLEDDRGGIYRGKAGDKLRREETT